MSEQMSKIDKFWLQLDSRTNLMIINGILQLDKTLDYDRVISVLTYRWLMKFDRFKKRVVKPISGVGVPSWEEDPEFDIRSHILRIALPEPGNQDVLEETISRLIATPLDENKPLWQFYMIENYNEGGTIFFGRIHHCIADGIALIHVLLSLTDLEPDAPWKRVSSKAKRNGNNFYLFDYLGNARKRIKETLVHSKIKARQVIQNSKVVISDREYRNKLAKNTAKIAFDASTVLSKLLIAPSDPKTCLKGKKLGVRKCVAWIDPPVSLEEVKTIGKAVNGTLNDVLIGILTGAIRRYLIHRNDRTHDIRVTVPVNIRPKGKEMQLGNNFTLVYLPLPVSVKDPIMRLKEVKRRMDVLKTSPDPIVNYLAMNVLGYTPEKVSKNLSAIFANKATAVLTNVPGPRVPLYFAGAKITNMMFWVPTTAQVGIGISIISYDGTLTLGIISDENLVPDPRKILDEFKEEYKMILDMVKSGTYITEPLVVNDRYEEERLRVIAEKEAQLFPEPQFFEEDSQEQA